MSKFINLTSLLLLVLTIVLVENLAEGRSISNAVNEAIIKTIEVDDNEIIDCYDIYRQPSLDHPLLRNHTIQMRPNWYPKETESDNLGTLQLTQIWHNHGSCPEGTIPIRRNEKYYNPTLSDKDRGPKLSPYDNNDTAGYRARTHEYASISMQGTFFGAQAKINLWNPTLEEQGERSISQIWVVAGDPSTLNTVEAGWIVSLFDNGDKETRFFIYFTADGYSATGCFNHDCDGFVHTSSKIGLGCRFTELSTFNGDQKDATFNIHKDKSTGNWWIQIQGEPVGYYPSSLFTDLSTKSTTVSWGGEVVNFYEHNRHTKTQMGSGHLPSEGGYGTSSYFNWVQAVDENYTLQDPKNYTKTVTNANCYDLQIDDTQHNKTGFAFFYGGPGYGDKCQ